MWFVKWQLSSSCFIVISLIYWQILCRRHNQKLALLWWLNLRPLLLQHSPALVRQRVHQQQVRMNIFSLEGLCHCLTGHDWSATYKIESKESSKCYFQLVRIEKSPEDWEDIRIIKNRIWKNSATAAVFSCSSRGSPVFGTCQDTCQGSPFIYFTIYFS